jgi:hypothetical protein
MREQDISAALQQQVLDAMQGVTPLNITGSSSKFFLGHTAQASWNMIRGNWC